MAVEIGELQVSFNVDIVGSLAEGIRQALTPEGGARACVRAHPVRRRIGRRRGYDQ